MYYINWIDLGIMKVLPEQVLQEESQGKGQLTGQV
jgi:hypothetical protein